VNDWRTLTRESRHSLTGQVPSARVKWLMGLGGRGQFTSTLHTRHFLLSLDDPLSRQSPSYLA